MVGELKKVIGRVSTDHLQEPGRQYNIFSTQLVLDFIVVVASFDHGCLHGVHSYPRWRLA